MTFEVHVYCLGLARVSGMGGIPYIGTELHHDNSIFICKFRDVYN